MNKEKYNIGTIHNINHELDLGRIYKKIYIRSDNKTNFEIEILLAKKFSLFFNELINKFLTGKKDKIEKGKDTGKIFQIRLILKKLKKLNL